MRSARPVGGQRRGRRRQRDGGSGRRQQRHLLARHRHERGHARGSQNARSRRSERDIMKSLNILIPMHLAGQERNRCHCQAVLGSQNGYAMVALLVSLSVMAIMLVVAMPVWHQASSARRKRSWCSAASSTRAPSSSSSARRRAPAAERRRARRPEVPAQEIQGSDHGRRLPARAAGRGHQRARSRGRASGTTLAAGLGTPPPAGRHHRRSRPRRMPARSPAVLSAASWASRARARRRRILIYNGRTQYNEWQFVYVAQTQTPGAGRRHRRSGAAPGARQRGWRSGTRRAGGRPGPAGRPTVAGLRWPPRARRRPIVPPGRTARPSAPPPACQPHVHRADRRTYAALAAGALDLQPADSAS